MKHLKRWLVFYRTHHLDGRPFRPGDLLFPSLGLPNGIVYPKKEMATSSINALMKEFIYGARIIPQVDDARFPFTTHTLRRGGAQYRFMRAPVGDRWPLEWIRWWGAWAEDENVS